MEYAKELTGTAKILYKAGYNAAIHFGESPEAAHQAGLKQASKIGKLRKLAQSGSIIKH
jgi:hypothetical protein